MKVSTNVSTQVLTETCRNCEAVPRFCTAKASSRSLDSILKAKGIPEGFKSCYLPFLGCFSPTRSKSHLNLLRTNQNCFVKGFAFNDLHPVDRVVQHVYIYSTKSSGLKRKATTCIVFLMDNIFLFECVYLSYLHFSSISKSSQVFECTLDKKKDECCRCWMRG
jgi:hypothetical protein